MESEHWNGQAILNRAKILANKALELFAVESVEVLQTTNNSADYDRYTLLDRNTVAGTTPVVYTFCGETVAVKSYAAILTSMVNTLYDLDASLMEKIAKEKYKPTSGDRVYVTTNSKDLRKPKEISTTGIFYEMNLSASSILMFIESLIEQYEMDPDDFEFQCKR